VAYPVSVALAYPVSVASAYPVSVALAYPVYDLVLVLVFVVWKVRHALHFRDH
jgi:hypothetical protein